jgi:cyclic pyranopterin phosphate synthase
MRFIELMPIQDHDEFGESAYVPYSRVLEKLPDAMAVAKDGGVAKLYRLPGAQGNIGLISPISAHFCGECNRLRLTADGKLKPCLHSGDEYSIKGLDKAGMKDVFEQAIWNKPAWHGDLDAVNRSKAGRNMNEIGG